MKELQIKDEFIKLGQALKLCGIAGNGVDAKIMILEEQVSVNGQVCTMRGKKLVPGDRFSCEGQEFQITSKN